MSRAPEPPVCLRDGGFVALQGMDHPKRNLIGLSLADLTAWVGEMGEQPYRGTQLFRWIYQRKATSFKEMTDIARSFRDHLSDVADLRLPEIVGERHSPADGTALNLNAVRRHTPHSNRMCATRQPFTPTGAL